MRRLTEGQRLGAAMFACVLLTLGSSIGSLLGANALAEQGRRESELKFCQIVSYARQTEERKVAGYSEEPPATEAGKKQREQTIIALRTYQDLEHSLGCPYRKERAR